MEQRLRAERVQVTFFGTCMYSGSPLIEDLGNALGTTIRNLNVPQVDIATHSMGDVFTIVSFRETEHSRYVYPTADPQVRKWVSIATPNFGALIPSIIANSCPTCRRGN